jgi:drug/metabolite transporter (DMT)-like permease
MHILVSFVIGSLLFLVLAIIRLRKRGEERHRLRGWLFLLIAFGLACIANRAWSDYKISDQFNQVSAP